MELIRQLWITSVPFRVLVCVTGVSLVLAISTGNEQTASSDTSAVDAIAPPTDDDDSNGLLGQIKKHLPGQQPTTPAGQAAKVANDMTDLGAATIKQGTKAAGNVADQVLGDIGK